MAYTGKPEYNLIRSDQLAAVPEPFAWDSLPDVEPPPADDVAPPAPGEAHPMLQGYGINEIVQEAERLIAEAEAQADAIRAAAHEAAGQETERRYAEALEQARREVREQADPEREQALEDLRHAAQALVTAAHAVQQQTDAHFAALEHQLAVSAVEVAGHLVGEAVQHEPAIVQRAVQEVLSRLSAGEVTLRLNPADLPAIQAALLELQAERSVGDIISFEADPRVERGGCIGQGESGTVESLPSAQLDQLRDLATN